jgi:hypothetical protein
MLNTFQATHADDADLGPTRVAESALAPRIHVLMIAFEDCRFAAARLVEPLVRAGFRVAALCPDHHPIAVTRFTEARFLLKNIQSSRHLEIQLCDALKSWQPRLILPADEQAVAWLQSIVKRAKNGKPGRFAPQDLQVIADSLCDIAQMDAMLMKTHTQNLARELGIRVPAGMSVTSTPAALEAVAQLGLPIYVKNSFGSGGRGVRLCRTQADVVAALDAWTPRKPSALHRALKKLAHRDWFPVNVAVDMQQRIVGTPSMFCAVAYKGKMLAGYAGITRQTCYESGPSSVVWIGAHAEMAEASEALIAAMGATGFIGFDFMIDDADGHAYLLECNPRPIPIVHLGGRIGADLCTVLAAALLGRPVAAAAPAAAEEITLFPQEWKRDPKVATARQTYHDVPWDDQRLLDAMVADAANGLPLPPGAPAPKLQA